MSDEEKITAETPTEEVVVDDELARLRQQLEMANARASAMEAQVAARDAMAAVNAVASDGLKMVHVLNLTDTEVHAQVTDRYGAARNLIWRVRGDSHPLTTIQFEELREKAPLLFSRGLIGTEQDIATNPNILGSMEEFLADIDIDDIDARIKMVDETSALMRMFHELETWRRIDTDEYGDPLTDPDGDLIVKFKEFSIPQKLLMDAVIARVAKLSGVQLQTSDG